MPDDEKTPQDKKKQVKGGKRGAWLWHDNPNLDDFDPAVARADQQRRAAEVVKNRPAKPGPAKPGHGQLHHPLQDTLFGDDPVAKFMRMMVGKTAGSAVVDAIRRTSKQDIAEQVAEQQARIDLQRTGAVVDPPPTPPGRKVPGVKLHGAIGPNPPHPVGDRDVGGLADPPPTPPGGPTPPGVNARNPQHWSVAPHSSDSVFGDPRLKKEMSEASIGKDEGAAVAAYADAVEKGKRVAADLVQEEPKPVAQDVASNEQVMLDRPRTVDTVDDMLNKYVDPESFSARVGRMDPFVRMLIARSMGLAADSFVSVEEQALARIEHRAQIDLFAQSQDPDSEYSKALAGDNPMDGIRYAYTHGGISIDKYSQLASQTYGVWGAQKKYSTQLGFELRAMAVDAMVASGAIPEGGFTQGRIAKLMEGEVEPDDLSALAVIRESIKGGNDVFGAGGSVEENLKIFNNAIGPAFITPVRAWYAKAVRNNDVTIDHENKEVIFETLGEFSSVGGFVEAFGENALDLVTFGANTYGGENDENIANTFNLLEGIGKDMFSYQTPVLTSTMAIGNILGMNPDQAAQYTFKTDRGLILADPNNVIEVFAGQSVEKPQTTTGK